MLNRGRALPSKGRGHRFESCRVRHGFAFCLKGLRPRQNSSRAQFSDPRIISGFFALLHCVRSVVHGAEHGVRNTVFAAGYLEWLKFALPMNGRVTRLFWLARALAGNQRFDGGYSVEALVELSLKLICVLDAVGAEFCQLRH
jgi:hypothetical protein